MSTVNIEAPGRLAFSLIDLCKGHRRVNGGAGVSISQPHFRGVIQPSTNDEVSGESFSYQEEVLNLLGELRAQFGCGPVAIDVKSQIPAHRGFGSKTATLLAVAKGVLALFGKEVPTAALVKLTKRGRTSGIGVNTFDRGGFVIDGGHPVSSACDGQFVPTRFSTRDACPPLLYSAPFPWPILIILPIGKIVEGVTELEHFQRICPIPADAVHEIAYLICFQMAAAMAENDYASFCASINGLQRAYWKAHQLELQSDELRYVHAAAFENGIDAIGLSSNGPALYAFSRNPSLTNSWLDDLIHKQKILSYWWTDSPKQGAILTMLSEEEK